MYFNVFAAMALVIFVTKREPIASLDLSLYILISQSFAMFGLVDFQVSIQW